MMLDYYTIYEWRYYKAIEVWGYFEIMWWGNMPSLFTNGLAIMYTWCKLLLMIYPTEEAVVPLCHPKVGQGTSVSSNRGMGWPTPLFYQTVGREYRCLLPSVCSNAEHSSFSTTQVLPSVYGTNEEDRIKYWSTNSFLFGIPSVQMFRELMVIDHHSSAKCHQENLDQQDMNWRNQQWI